MIPPMLIFPRVHSKEHFVKVAPTGSIVRAHPSGWMTMKHFVSHVRPSNKDKVLLLLDNYHSTSLWKPLTMLKSMVSSSFISTPLLP